jgi:hypothetical protein
MSHLPGDQACGPKASATKRKRRACAVPTRRAATLPGLRPAPPRHGKNKRHPARRRVSRCIAPQPKRVSCLKEKPSLGKTSQVRPLKLAEKVSSGETSVGPGFSRAAKLAKELIPCAAGSHAAQRSARKPAEDDALIFNLSSRFLFSCLRISN